MTVRAVFRADLTDADADELLALRVSKRLRAVPVLFGERVVGESRSPRVERGLAPGLVGRVDFGLDAETYAELLEVAASLGVRVLRDPVRLVLTPGGVGGFVGVLPAAAGVRGGA